MVQAVEFIWIFWEIAEGGFHDSCSFGLILFVVLYLFYFIYFYCSEGLILLGTNSSKLKGVSYLSVVFI